MTSRAGQERLIPSREATTGVARLDAFIEAWTAYLPIIYPSARALLAMRETDEDAGPRLGSAYA